MRWLIHRMNQTAHISLQFLSISKSVETKSTVMRPDFLARPASITSDVCLRLVATALPLSPSGAPPQRRRRVGEGVFTDWTRPPQGLFSPQRHFLCPWRIFFHFQRPRARKRHSRAVWRNILSRLWTGSGPYLGVTADLPPRLSPLSGPGGGGPRWNRPVSARAPATPQAPGTESGPAPWPQRPPACRTPPPGTPRAAGRAGTR